MRATFSLRRSALFPPEAEANVPPLVVGAEVARHAECLAFLGVEQRMPLKELDQL
jgi:hypothetical protein